MSSMKVTGAAPARPAPVRVLLAAGLLVVAALLGIPAPAPQSDDGLDRAATPRVVEDWRGNSARIGPAGR